MRTTAGRRVKKMTVRVKPNATALVAGVEKRRKSGDLCSDFLGEWRFAAVSSRRDGGEPAM